MHFKSCGILIIAAVVCCALPAVGQQADTPVIPFGEPVEGSLTDTQTYLLELDSAQTISIIVAGDIESFVFSSLYDASGERIAFEWALYSDGADQSIYALPAAGSYQVVLEGSGSYTLTVLEGNQLTLDGAPLTAGGEISGSNPDGRIVIHPLDAAPGSAVTLEYVGAVETYLVSVDGGSYISSTYDPATSITSIVYQLDGEPPYEVWVEETGDYTLRVVGGDSFAVSGQPRAPDSPIYGVFEPGKTVTHAFDAAPGDTITLQIDVESLEHSTNVDILDATGSRIIDYDWYSERTTSFYIYRLSGEAPYQLRLSGVGSYSVCLSLEDTRETRQMLTVGESLSGSVGANQVVIHPLDVAPDSLFRIELSGSIQSFAIHSAESSWSPQAVTLSGGQTAMIYEAEGDYMPFSIVLTQSGSYTIRLYSDEPQPLPAGETVSVKWVEGDALRIDGGALAFGETVSGTIPPGQLVFYTLDVTETETFSLRLREGGTATSFSGWGVLDAANQVIEPSNARPEADGQTVTAVYEVGGAAALTLVLLGDDQTYTVEAFAGDVIAQPDLLPPMPCSVSGAGVNQRGGAGTSFAVVGALAAGERATVIGQAVGTDGLVWWQLDSGWVRSDVVTTTGDCSAVPLAAP